jgi:hypothetical protein
MSFCLTLICANLRMCHTVTQTNEHMHVLSLSMISNMLHVPPAACSDRGIVSSRDDCLPVCQACDMRTHSSDVGIMAHTNPISRMLVPDTAQPRYLQGTDC